MSKSTLLLLLLLFSPALAEPTLSVMGNAEQGWPLFVTVTAEPGATATIEWADEEFDLTEGDDQGQLRTVLPVPRDLAPGKHELVVRLADGQTLSRTIPVKSRNYGSQSITLPESTLANYDNPQNKADDEAILEALKPFDPEQRWHGQFHYPVEAPESTGYGLRRTYNGWKKSWHKGLDLAGWEGEAVLAPADGVVLHTARGIVNGNTVVISHGLGVGSSYFHMNSIAVREGQKVSYELETGRDGFDLPLGALGDDLPLLRGLAFIVEPTLGEGVDRA